MRLPLSARIAAALTVCALAAGCGQTPPQTIARCASDREIRDSQQAQAPRRIELSTNLRPLLPVTDDAPHADSAAAYTEPSSTAQRLPRIREMSATPDPAGRGTIREPCAAAAEVQEPAPRVAGAERPRGSYVPLAMPQIGPPAIGKPPQLAAKPNFERPVMMPPAAAAIAAAPVAVPQAGSYRAADFARPAPAFIPAAYPVARSTASREPTPVDPISLPTSPKTNSPGIQAAIDQATQISDQAVIMVQRGMLYSARADLLKALQVIAQGLDAVRGGAIHGSALAAGLTALDEAADFTQLPAAAADANSALIIASRHRTRLLQVEHAAPLSPTAAQQQYLAYAQSQLAISAGGLPVASQTLYRLGRLHTGLSATQHDPQAMLIPRAMVFHQAALAADPKNYLAANELGVLLARCGQLAEARNLLLRSVSIRPHAEAWQNLATVHERLGESDLAKRAAHERDLAAQNAGGPVATTGGAVRWVDAKTFAASGGGSPLRDGADQQLAAAAASKRR